MSGEQISIEVFKEILKQSIVQFDNEREHPHAKCEMAMRETYHDLLTVVNDIKHTIDKVAADVQTIKQRQDDLDNKLILLQKITSEHSVRIRDLEEWREGVDNIQKAVRKRVFVTIWATVSTAIGFAFMAAWEYIKSHAEFSFK